jgi:hypothetical protein
MSIVLNSSGGGSVTINEPTTASNFTQTLPAATGTVMVSGNMPAFSAYRATSAQVISLATWTKVSLNAETFDTNNNFDSTTNFRFTPTVAGYYQINGEISYSAVSGLTVIYAAIYKNGSAYINNFSTASYGAGGQINLSSLIYFNGSSDYIELYGYVDTGNVASFAANFNTTMSGSMVRAA